MRKPYLEHFNLYPLDIYVDGKQVLSYRPDEQRRAIDLKKAIQTAIEPSFILTSQISGIEKIVSEWVSPVIAENYADGIKQLSIENHLFNPSFADDAEGWDMSVDAVKQNKVKLIVSDYKVRLRLLDGGWISQSNERIRKPDKHKVYKYTKKEEGEEGNPEEDSVDSFMPSEELVTDPVGWEEIKQPEKVSGEEEQPDTLYLSLSFICKESGTISVGFPESDQTLEKALKTQTVHVYPSEGIQTIATQGIWDGKGSFRISLLGGHVEIVSLRLLGKRMEEFTKQSDSFSKQTAENFTNSFEFAKQAIARMTLIQNHINQLYSNDAVLSSLISGLSDDVEELSGKVLSFDSSFKNVLQRITDIEDRLTELEESGTT